VGFLLPVAPLPWATLAVNVVGSLCLGVVVARASRHRRTGLSLPFLGPGLLGSFTTYSTFAVETNWLLATRPAVGAAYAIASLVGGVAAARWGYRLGRW
jgi:CrcB protein